MPVESCPPSIAIGELTLGLLDGDDARTVVEHLLGCRLCVLDWDGFRGFLAKPDMPQLPCSTRSSLRDGKGSGCKGNHEMDSTDKGGTL